MAATSAYQSIRLVDPLLLNCVEATDLLSRINDRDETTSFSTSRLGLPLNGIEKNLISILVLLLNRTDRCRHPFKDTSLEENCFKSILRGCSHTLSAIIYNLSRLELREFLDTAAWEESQNLLDIYDRSLAKLHGILNSARTDQSLSDFLNAINASNNTSAKLKQLIDDNRKENETIIAVQHEQPSLANGAHPAHEFPFTQPPSRRSTIVDGIATPTQAHANCSGYRRGLQEGREQGYENACDTLRVLNIFEQEPPTGKRATWLMKAIDKSSAQAVKLLIDLGANVNQLSSKTDFKDPKYLPLCYATRTGNTTIVELLLEKGADLNAKDYFGNNALLSAASSGQDKVIELLLGAPYNADIEVQRTGTGDRRGFTPLMMAVRSGKLSAMKMLLAYDANSDAVNLAGDRLLHIAAEMNRLKTIELLVRNGAQIVTINEQTGDTALHCAVRKGSLDVATYLIDISDLLLIAENKKKQTPLTLAVKMQKPDMVTMLIQKGSNPDLLNSDGRTSLHNAVISNDSEIVKILTRAGTKIDTLDNDGHTPLHHAVMAENPSTTAILLSKGHKMDVRDRSGRCSLQYVMEMPSSNEAKALPLLHEFLKVHVKGQQFHSEYHALPRAARDGKLELVKEILSIDPKLVDLEPSAASGYQPLLHEAVQKGREEVVKILCARRSYTLPMNKKDSRGRTALHQAIISKQPAMISLLIEKGADKELPTGQDDGFLPPLHLAAREQNLEAVVALLAKGADPKKRIPGGEPCDRCWELKRGLKGENARCILRNLDSTSRNSDFQKIDITLRNAINA